MVKRRKFDERLFKRLWREGKSITEIATAVDRSYKTCQDLRSKLGLRKRGRAYRSKVGGIKFKDPTKLEISEACARIRATWTPEEHERRRAGVLPPDDDM